MTRTVAARTDADRNVKTPNDGSSGTGGVEVGETELSGMVIVCVLPQSLKCPENT